MIPAYKNHRKTAIEWREGKRPQESPSPGLDDRGGASLILYGQISTHSSGCQRYATSQSASTGWVRDPGLNPASVFPSGLAPDGKAAGTGARRPRARHVLVQAAWSYRFPPGRGVVLKRRQEGQPPDAIAHSWKAQHRLHKVFKRLAMRKNSQIAAVAVARELAGFVWALMQDRAGESEAARRAA